MKNYTLLIGTAALSGLVAVSAPAMAQGYGNEAGANTSTQGSVNSNGVNTTDRDLGQDRARERANANSRLNTTNTARNRSGAANPTYSGANQNAPDHSQHDQAGGENSATPTPSQ